ncbi:MAG: Coiled coil protein [Myxococcales bacterium]|nr:Coiled coil protein [Myxococcales bacterium]
MTTRESYQEQMELQLKQWSVRLEELQLKAEKASADVKTKLTAELAELKKLDVAARQHLAAFEAAAATTWETVKADFTDKWNHVSGAVDALWARVS